MKVLPVAVALLGTSMMMGFSDAGMEPGPMDGFCDCAGGEGCDDDFSCCCNACGGGGDCDVRALEGEHRNLDLFLRHGKCCNNSGETQYALVDIPPCQWIELANGACTGGWFSHDCEGMTCGGGFYKVSGSSTGNCVTPGQDSPPYDKRRWTPTEQDCNAKSPQDICGRGVSNTPPGDFEYGPRPGCKRMLVRASIEAEVPSCGGCVDEVEYQPQEGEVNLP